MTIVNLTSHTISIVEDGQTILVVPALCTRNYRIEYSLVIIIK